jgi:hypothetical protein
VPTATTSTFVLFAFSNSGKRKSSKPVSAVLVVVAKRNISRVLVVDGVDIAAGLATDCVAMAVGDVAVAPQPITNNAMVSNQERRIECFMVSRSRYV